MKLYELQQTFDEMTAQLKELDNCVSPDKNSEQYKTLWDDRAEIRVRLDKLNKDGGCCVCGEEAVARCSCKTLYCNEHYKTTVMTGNCCRDNEREFE